MDILLNLMLYLGPVAVCVCIIAALRGTKARRIDDCPTWLKTSAMNMNGPLRQWRLSK